MNQHSKDLKEQVFKRYLCGLDAKELAREFIIPLSTIYTWRKAWKLSKRKISDSVTQDVGALLLYARELNQQLELADLNLKIIHDSRVLQMLPATQRIEAARQLSNTYSVLELCRALEISPSVFYYHLRKTDQALARQQKTESLCVAIRKVFIDSGCRLGAERIRIQLQKFGISITKKRIIRLMSAMHLSCKMDTVAYYECSFSVSQGNVSDVKIL